MDVKMNEIKQKENEPTIILNVGGVKYETLRSTLTAYPDTLLGTMFAERNEHLLKPKNGNEYFFDRNGRVFHYIMEYYRTGIMNWSYSKEKKSDNDDVTQQELDTELDYFQIKVEARRAENITPQLGKFLNLFASYLVENLSKQMEIMEPEIWFKVSPDTGPKFWTKNSGWIASPFTSNKPLAFYLMKNFKDEIYQHLKLVFKGTRIETKSQTNDVVEFVFAPYYNLPAILNLANLKV
ncbi:5242_t:CDS:2 [Ambispora leptoticha]|uniref:5242_t:CDS:1 n=1 Tax=Ambispora leptoticha TaxID=144679 RepID=A0A9N9ELW7_9GLOM|nr:5242_t:CDS:2 [Ambispora leptoticha]